MKLWIARDKRTSNESGTLYAYSEEPELVDLGDDAYFEAGSGQCIQLDPKLFPKVTFENSPLEVELEIKIIKLTTAK